MHYKCACLCVHACMSACMGARVCVCTHVHGCMCVFGEVTSVYLQGCSERKSLSPCFGEEWVSLSAGTWDHCKSQG